MRSKSIRIRIRISIFELAVGVLLTSALFAGGSGEQTPPPEEAELQSVTMILDWTPNVNHVGIFVARDRGFFARQGIRVELIQPGELFAPAAVAAGRADFGVDFQESVTLLQATDAEIVSVAALLQTNTSGFAVRAADNIAGPVELAGLRYATFQSPFERPTLDALVRCAGGDPAEITFVPGGSDLLAALATDSADIAWIYFGTQGFQAQRVGLEIDYFPLSDWQECIPDYYTPVIIAARDTVERRPDMARRFLRALRMAHEYVVEQPQGAAAILARAVPELDETELRASVPWLAQYMLHAERGWGWQEAGVWREYANWMRANGLLDASVDIDAAFTTVLLPIDE